MNAIMKPFKVFVSYRAETELTVYATGHADAWDFVNNLDASPDGWSKVAKGKVEHLQILDVGVEEDDHDDA